MGKAFKAAVLIKVKEEIHRVFICHILGIGRSPPYEIVRKRC